MKKFRQLIFNVWMRVPFGHLLKFKDGKNTITVTKALWVITSDGDSQDALPLNFCSQEFVDDVEKRLVRKYGFIKNRTDS